MHCAEYRDLVAADVDRALTAEEAALVRTHVAGCPRCARVRADAEAFKRACRARSWIQPVPADVRQRLLAALDTEARPAGSTGGSGARRRPWTRLLLAGAIAAVLLLMVVPLRFSRTSPAVPAEPFATIVRDFKAVEAQAVALQFRTDSVDEMRRYYAQSGALDFPNTVPNLDPFGYRVEGGSVMQLGTKRSTLTVYRGPQGIILCHRILDPGMQPPPGGETVGMDTFYTVNGITICMHREGDVVCFMAVSLPRDEFIRQWTHATMHAA